MSDKSQAVSEERQPLTAAERKKAQRLRDASRGYVEITVKVPVDRVEDARAWCSKLKPAKPKKADARQADLFPDGAPKPASPPALS